VAGIVNLKIVTSLTVAFQGGGLEMITYPKGVTIKKIVTYYDEDIGVSVIVSKRSGGIGAPDYLITSTKGFTATRKTREKAIRAARKEMARLKRAERDAQTS
jgi:hypothetical protein